MEVDGQAGSKGERVKDGFESRRRLGVRTAEDKGVVGVLEHRAGERGVNRVSKPPIRGSRANKTLEDIGDKNKKARRKRVPLTEAIAAKDPVPRDTVEKDGGVSCRKNVSDPTAPPGVESTG